MNGINTLLLTMALTVSLSACGALNQRGARQSSQTPDVDVSTDARRMQEAELPTVRIDPDDLDGDGIANRDDECADTVPAMAVNERGCPTIDGVIDGVSFASGQHELDADGQAALDALIIELMAYPETVIRIEGHTDNRGLAAENLELSKQRVLAVARYLVESGIAPERLKPVGYGEGRPRAVNATPEGRELNRRIVIKVVSVLPATS